ncbi:MAG: trimethylamine methyltransferase family protein, partial [Nitrospinales bacterium]
REEMAIDAIRETGPNGHYLTHEHTLKHVRNTQWRPSLLNRMGFEEWETSGSPSFFERARDRLDKILNDHRPPPLPEQKKRKIQNRIDRF